MSTATVALVWRMLAAGTPPVHVAYLTGVDLDEVLELKMEMP